MADPKPPTGFRAVRLMKGWGIKALADAIDVEESTIWRIETGAIKAPRLEIRIALAKALKMKQADLFRKMER